MLRHSDNLPPAAARALDGLVQVVPDFPKPGIVFRNILPALGNAACFRSIVDALAAPYTQKRPDLVLGIESRGFIFAAAVAAKLGVGFVAARKPGKLPGPTDRVAYSLEYADSAVLELQHRAIPANASVVVIDDVLVTGGTADAAAQLVNMQNGFVMSHDFVIELDGLGGRRRLLGESGNVRWSPTGGFHALVTY